MDRWALTQAVEMLEAKAENGQLSSTTERHVRELLAEGHARRAFDSLAGRTEAFDLSAADNDLDDVD